MTDRYIFFNPNPKGKKTSDCVIRMLCRIFDMSWREAYIDLSRVALRECEMPSSNFIWETYLKQNGFKRNNLPDTCPDCITVREFASLYSQGIFVACTGSHVVAVISGRYYDAWDSGDEVVSYFYSLI